MARSHHAMKLQDPHYDNIKNGLKIYETRVNDPKRQRIQVGDIITISHSSNPSLKPYTIVIIERTECKSFEEAISEVGISKVLPNTKTLKEGIKLYESFPHAEGTYKDGAKKYGVVRFGLKVNLAPTSHILRVKKLYLEMIKSGKKVVEGRINVPRYHSYQEGDVLTFRCGSQSQRTLIIRVAKYSDVKEYLKKETLKKTHPGIRTMEEGMKIYHKMHKPNEILGVKVLYGHGIRAFELVLLN